MSTSSQPDKRAYRFRPPAWTADGQRLWLRNPWRRLWAKVADLAMAGVLVGIILVGLTGFITPHNTLSISTILPCFALGVIAYDTLFLAVWGNTPGKRFWGLAVQTPYSSSISWELALTRSVWVNGLLFLSGLIPLMPLALLVYQKQRLCRSGFTSWDAPQQTLVYRPDASYQTP